MTASEVFVSPKATFLWITPSGATPILVDSIEDKGVMRAIANLQRDAEQVTGQVPSLSLDPNAREMLIVGTVQQNRCIPQFIKDGKIDGSLL